LNAATLWVNMEQHALQGFALPDTTYQPDSTQATG
jgi:hypothetical protein